MVRSSEHETHKIYQSARPFRTNCLLQDGSMLSEGAFVWHLDALDRNHKEFTATPDEDDQSFIVKFMDLIGQATQVVMRPTVEFL